LFRGKKGANIISPSEYFLVEPGFGFVSKNHGFYMFQNLSFENVADYGHGYGNLCLWLNQLVPLSSMNKKYKH